MLRTSGENVIGAIPPHSHQVFPQKAQANIIKSMMKEEINNIGATARNVIGSSLIGVSSDVTTHLPKQSSLTRTLLRHRQGAHLPNPSNPNFSIPEKYAHLILLDSGEDDEDRILAIGDKELLKELENETIFGNGTFDKVPNVFYQLYTWHARVGNSYPPCVYFLLQRKNMGTYNKMFQMLKELLPNLSPQKILVDFEKACISSAYQAFPYVEVKGCYFHLCQSLIRKINTVGLKGDYEADIQVHLKLKSLAALAFVPINEVRAVFDSLAATFPDDEKYNEVLTYFFSTYIEGAAGRDPQFPIRVWNQTKAQVGEPEVKKKTYEVLQERVAAVVQGYQQEQDKLKYLRRVANLQ